MMSPSLETLFISLENESVSFEPPVLFLGAAYHPFLKNLPDPDLWQPFRPYAEQLEAQNFEVLSEIPSGKTYGLVLVNLPKQVEEAKHWLALGLESLKPGGCLLVSAANDAGGNRLEKWFKELGLEPSSLSKNKCRTVWAERPQNLPAIVTQWKNGGLSRSVNIGDGIQLISQPGLFSWDRVDPGSRILARHISSTLAGVGADFGAGTGYLSHHILQTCPKATRLYVLEADARALACAKQNLSSERSLIFGWNDLSKPVGDLPRLDFIIMNPPFHTGKKTENHLGQSFIKTAAHHLKKGGILLIVANNHLPYEEILQEQFAAYEILAQKDGFKVIQSVK